MWSFVSTYDIWDIQTSLYFDTLSLMYPCFKTYTHSTQTQLYIATYTGLLIKQVTLYDHVTSKLTAKY